MPDIDNDNYNLLLEQIDAFKEQLAATNKRLDEVTEFNRQLLNSRKPEQQSQHDDADDKAAKEKLQKYLED